MPSVFNSQLVSIPWTTVRSLEATRPDTARQTDHSLILTMGLIIDPSLYAVDGSYLATFRVQDVSFDTVSTFVMQGRLKDLKPSGTFQPKLDVAYSQAWQAGVTSEFEMYLFRPYFRAFADSTPMPPAGQITPPPSEQVQFAMAEEHYFILTEGQIR
jgi:hypothetical protein